MLKSTKITIAVSILMLSYGFRPVSAQNTSLTTSTALPGTGTGFNNIAIGPGNVYNSANNANNNVFIGLNAGTAITTGDESVFIGTQAGYAATIGISNSFLGHKAGYSTYSGSYNSFVGSQAGFYNTTGFYNTFVGYQSGLNNTQGSFNMFTGGFSGAGNTTGNSNAFVGYFAGYKNTTGNYNAFFGSSAGYSNTTGTGNLSVGYQAGNSSTTGNYNSFLGTYSGYNNTTGNNNAFMGYQAGFSNTTGLNNTLLGTEAGYNNTTGGNNAFIGYRAGYSNTLGNNNAYLGYEAGYSNSFGTSNSFVGDGAGYFNGGGNANAFLGKLAGVSNTSGSNNTYLGTSTDGIGTNAAALQRATALGYKALVAVNDGLVLGDTTNVKVGIGTAYPSQKFTLRGNMNFVAYDNSMMLKNQPFLHFNEHESLALGVGAEIPSGAEKTLVLGSKETTVQIPGIVNGYLPHAGQFLTVDERGNVRLSQPRVQVASVADWSDKVFEPGYTLRPLGEVEDFVKKNKHLPGVPSAAEMVAEGMESAAFNAKLLEKIEELTLYAVELEKKNALQDKHYGAQQQQIDALRSLVLDLTKAGDNR